MPASRLLLILALLFVTVGLGTVAAEIGLRWENANQIVIGNTAGTLSAVIQLEESMVVFGGGDSRNDLAELVGRSTLPWRRQVDLLIVPGADERHVVGSLGLIERGSVTAIAVLGQPRPTGVWARLAEEAARRSIRLTYIPTRSRLSLGEASELELIPASGDGGSQVSAMLVRHGAGRIAFIDALPGQDVTKALGIVGPVHAVATLRLPAEWTDSPNLLIQPGGERGRQVELASAGFVAELADGQRLTVELSHNEIRLPRNRLIQPSSATPAARPEWSE